MNNQSEKEGLKSEKSGIKSNKIGERNVELPARKEIPNEGIETGPSNSTLKNQSEKGSLKSEKSGIKWNNSGQRYVELPGQAPLVRKKGKVLLKCQLCVFKCGEKSRFNFHMKSFHKIETPFDDKEVD